MNTQLLDKAAILALITTFVNQSPGLEPGNYTDTASYRSEYRVILNDLHIARELLDVISSRKYILDTDIIDQLDGINSRIRLTHDLELDYCIAQYFPTEYRDATCHMLMAAIKQAVRRDLGMGASSDDIRKQTKTMLSRRAQRYIA